MRIAVTCPDAPLREQWVAALAARLPGAQVLAWSGQAMDASHAVGWNPPAEFFDRVRGLRAYFSMGAGVEGVLALTNLPAAMALVRLEDAGMARQMAEYCCHEVFRYYRRYGAYETQQREQRWQERDPAPGEPCPVGVLGLGTLGAHVARVLAGFGYPVLGYSRTPRSIEGVTCLAGDDALPGFLARSRVLILMAPLTAQTRNLIDAHALAQMPRGAWLINVARGALIDDQALLASLDAGHLAGATLDVFRTEPLPAEHPFWRHPGIRITPHIAAVTHVPESADQIAAKILAFSRGESVGGTVERTRGY